MNHRAQALSPEAAAPRILLRFPHPAPPRTRRAPVLPFFLPFAGCPGRCVFCDQQGQTGQAPRSLEAAQAELAKLLTGMSPARPVELAFYGGTFTALPEPWPERFLELAAPALADGRLAGLRCSTRPDALGADTLARLSALGLSLVELGVQSFDDAALMASRRGYTGAQALAGCEAVRAAGLRLGIQLMPGLPGHTRAAFRRDMEQTASLGPELARLYPCLVLEGTELAETWRAGNYAPWDLAECVEALAEALLVLWDAGVPAARVGVLEQQGLAVLAGPRHPALGQMARARALFLHVRRRLAELPGLDAARVLFVPERLRGELLGQKNALAGDYAGLGLSLSFWDAPDLALAAG